MRLYRFQCLPTENDVGTVAWPLLTTGKMVAQQSFPSAFSENAFQIVEARHDKQMRIVERTGNDHTGAPRQLHGRRGTGVEAPERGGHALVIPASGFGEAPSASAPASAWRTRTY